MIHVRCLCTLLFAGLLAGCVSIERLAIPDPVALRGFDSGGGADLGPSHDAWTMFLQRYVQLDANGVARVGYGGVSGADRAALASYIAALSSLDASTLSRAAQLAYWVNLYNATTVAVVLDHYPVDSIRSIGSGLFAIGPWGDKRLVVNGRSLSLHDIEHGIVRPLWSDRPEIHYLLNCAAVGCPNLGLRAYTATNIDAALTAAAQSFVNDPRGVTVLDGGRLRLSKIYAWYREDFGGSDSAVLDHLRRYAADDLRKQLTGLERIDSYAYDWALNDQALAMPR